MSETNTRRSSKATATSTEGANGRRDDYPGPPVVRRTARPTVEFDLAATPRFDPNNIVYRGFARYKGQEEAARLRQRSQQRTQQWAQERRPGFSLRDRALLNAGWTATLTGGVNCGILSWTKVPGSRVATPQELGVESYRASPEEAAQTVKAAARFFGADLVGISPLKEAWVYSHVNNKAVLFEDVTEPQETDESYIIPKSCRWVISCAVPMSRETLMMTPSPLGEAASSGSYSRATLAVASLAEFIRGLGYVAIPDCIALLLQVPFAVMAGLGELGRVNRMVTPQYGPLVRLGSVITDLPLALDSPIDFGLMEYCRTCRRCAEACPARALSFEEEPYWQTKGPWNNPGKRTWFEDSLKCYTFLQGLTIGTCSLCVTACPWAWPDRPFDGRPNSEARQSWWERDLPPYGVVSR